MGDSYHQKLKKLIHEFIIFVYKITKDFPQSELYGASSQLRRAAVSIMLNYVEGYARRKEKVKLNFYETSYGSTQECKYVIYLAYTQSWLIKTKYSEGEKMINEIGKMLWAIIDGMETKIKNES